MEENKKQEVIRLLEDIMKLSLCYCKDSDDEIQACAVRVNKLAHKAQVIVERHLD
jgi:hypothetical protein